MMKARRFAAMLLVGWLGPSLAIAQQVEGGDVPVDPPAFKSPLKDRPLFSPTRSAPLVPEVIEQVPEEAPVPVVEATPPPPWRLVGVVRKSSGAIALFAVEGGPSFQLREGDQRDGWTLAEVGRRDAVLKEGERVHKVKMGAGAPTGVDASAPAPDAPPATDPSFGVDPNMLFDENGMPIDPSATKSPTGQNPPRRDAVRKVGERPQRPRLTAPPAEAPQSNDFVDPTNGGVPFDVDGGQVDGLGGDNGWPQVDGNDNGAGANR